MAQDSRLIKKICLNKSVLDFMAEHLTPESVALEFGSGWSSSWFAERCKLVTVETDPKWLGLVYLDLHESRLKADVILTSPKTLERDLSFVHESSVDLALVDSAEAMRFQAALLAWKKLKSGGWLIFDDAQRPRHRGAISWLLRKAGQLHRLEWQPGDIDTATERVALAFQKT